jgi:hypothetical protein
MQLRWALWAMAIGSSSSSKETARTKASKKAGQKKTKKKSSSRGTNSRRSLFRKGSKNGDEEEESEEEEEENEEDDEEEQSLRWAADALLPRLRTLESSLLNRAVSGLWTRALDAVKAEKAEGAKGERRRSSSAFGEAQQQQQQQQERQVSAAEEAAGRWVDVLNSAARDAASSARASVPEPHAALFVARALGALLDKVDALLCEAATGVKEEVEEKKKNQRSNDDDSNNNRRATTTSPLLPPSFLPFDPRYPLTFTSGVGIKLAMGKIGLWAADAGVMSSSASSAATPNENDDGNDEGDETNNSSSAHHLPRLFPRLRAVADLLMMPKEALTDPVMRLEVLPHLSLKSVCGALARFKPDDNAPDPLPPGLLDVLRDQAEEQEYEEEEEEEKSKEQQKRRSLEGLLRAALAPVPERAMLARGLVPEPLSLEQTPESEGELDELEEAVGGSGAGDACVGLRFDLLRELWSSAR